MSEKQSNKTSKRNGIIATVLVHIGLILLVTFFGFTYIDPPIGDVSIGFEALGEEDAGSSEQLKTSEEVSDEQEVNDPTPTNSSPEETDVATQDDSPVDINTNKNDETQKDEVKNQEKPKDEPKDPEVDPRLKDLGSLINGENQDGGKGKNDKDGNQGKEDGVKDEEGKGGEGKNGMFDLDGRKAAKPGDLNHDCGISGRVKVRVSVNRQGNVTDAQISGGTSSNKCLRDKAILAAKATKYTKEPTGPVIQEGIIELYFQTK